ncbi:MAG TPA: carboxypeptidase regulatory-like domain-containing protein [Pyrinomonadaceae bacterium]|nr:carboxypeptidase regulatory-like domain-containing protein [Pyrinomonadaceae bacterium]
MKISLRGAMRLATLVLLTSSLAAAQDLDDVTIAGRITDSNNLPIVGATVTAIQTQSNAARTVISNDDGRYRFIELKPGTYKLTAIAGGFGPHERANISTVSGQNVQIDLMLAPADVRAAATVTAGDVPVVDTSRTVVGGTLSQREIEELPNNTRNPLDLVLALGGTSEEQLSTSGLAEDRFQSPPTAPLEQGNFSLSGGVAYSNNLTIDGLDNNDDRSSRDRFQPSLEAVEEVQIVTNQFSAEYGRASGGRINLRTRAGSNDLRGRIFMFFRDDSLNANSWYNNSRTPSVGRQPLTEYNPGFTLGGPVRLPIYDGRDRTFFSVAYEHDDVLDTTFIDTWVPVAPNPRFALPAPTSATCPETVSSCADASSSPAMPILPYQLSLATPNISHSFTGRVDHNFSDANSVTLGVQIGRRHNQRTTFPSTTRLDDALQVRNTRSDAMNFTDNHVFSSNVVNQIRGQYSTLRPSFQTSDPFAPVVLIGYTNPHGGSQTLTAGNSTAAVTGDATGFPQNRKEARIQVQDALTYLTGFHSLKTGFDVMTVRSKAIGLGDATGTFNFASVLNFQNNVLSRYRQNFGTASDVKNTYAGIFLNDEIKPWQNLTLSLGFRYERETAVEDGDNLGPRFGIAWDPFNDGKSVLRFGSGIFYNRVLLRTVADSIQNTGGDQVSFDTSLIPALAATDNRRRDILAAIATNFPAAFASPAAIRNLIVAACANVTPVPPSPCTGSLGFLESVTSTGNPLRTVESNLRIPESYQFNIGYEREVAQGLVFEANYTWNKTSHLWRDRNGNAPRLPAGYDDWTAWLVDHPFVLSPARMYTFFLGPRNDTNGLHANSQASPTVCGVSTANCFVNLNTTSSSTSTPLVAVPGTNNNATGGPIGIALAAVAHLRPDPNIEETSIIGSGGRAFYHGVVLEIRSANRQLGHGFGGSFRFNYTFSKSMDDGLNNTSNAEVNGDFGREWARNLQDRRHRLAFSGVFETPWWLGRLRLSPLLRWGSSAPFNIGNGGSDRNLDDLGTDRINYAGDPRRLRWRRPGSPPPTNEFIALFSLAPIGAPGGDLPRNAGHGPAFYTFDLSVTREWKFSERTRVRPVVQFDNILNAAVFNYGAGFIDFNGLTVSNAAARENFLVPTRTFRQRQIRLGIRFDF